MDFRKNKTIPLTRRQLRHAGPPPPGKYRFRVAKVQVVENRAGTGQVLRMTFEVASGAEEERQVVISNSLNVALDQFAKPLFAALGLLDDGADDDQEFSCEELVGREVCADLSFESSEGGREWPRLENIAAADAE